MGGWGLQPPNFCLPVILCFYDNNFIDYSAPHSLIGGAVPESIEYWELG